MNRGEVRPRRVTLGAWLALAFSALSVLLAVLLAYVIERKASEQARRDIGSNLAELAGQTVSRLDRGLYERHREIQLLAGRVDPGQDPRKLQAELDAMQASYRYYAWLGYADRDGRVQAASRGLQAGADVSQARWFQAALRGESLGDVHEAGALAGKGSAAPGEPLRFVDVAFPTRDGTGVVGAKLSWEWAGDVRAAVFSPIDRSRVIDPVIVNGRDEVLLGPPALQQRQLRLESLARARRGEAGFIEEDWPDGRFLVGYGGTRGFESSPGLGWSVLVRQELGAAYAPVREMRKSVLASGIAFAVLFSLLGWLVANAITRPLQELERSAREFGAGKRELVQPALSYREVETLSSSLNTLVSELQRNQETLRELNAQLEHRVAQRTGELQAAFEQVRSSEQRIRTILESAQDPYLGVDLQGRIIDWNAQAQVVFGWTRDEVLGRRLAETLLPADQAPELEAELHAFQATGGSQLLDRPHERILVDRSGREIPFEVKIVLVTADGERFFSAFVHDISQRKEVERLKDQFISTVSHELRTPLTAIYASLDLLVTGMAGDLPPEVRELMSVSHQSTERLIRLINDVLDVERIASGKADYRLQSQPLGPLVEQALRDTAAYAAGLQVRLRLAQADQVTVYADADRIVQVCVNLLSNAAKFSPTGGEVTVRVAAAGDHARVLVEDRGAGIPPGFRQRMFERFAQADASERRARGGTGLGLSICRGIVLAHGGRIDFDSEPGVRTVFWFELPLA